MTTYNIEITTASGQYVTIQRESTMEAYVKMAVSTEFKGCRIHRVTALKSPPNIQKTEQFPNYDNWFTQQTAARSAANTKYDTIDIQSIFTKLNILFKAGNYKETWILLGEYWESIDQFPMSWAMIMSCCLALGEKEFAHELSSEAMRLFGTHHQVLSIATSTSAAIGDKNEYSLRLNYLKRLNPDIAMATEEMCSQLYLA